MGKGKRLRESKEHRSAEQKYTLTKSGLEQMLTNMLNEKILNEGWLRLSDAREIISDDLVYSVNAGIKMVLIVLMEQHLIGSNRITRDIEPHVQAIYDEWSDAYESSKDIDYTLEILEDRFNRAKVNSTRRLRE